ncbi:MAG TPA: 30S ribosomal protein S16 [bacterium]|nr:30S ribosomal protein S16 [bacterium]
MATKMRLMRMGKKKQPFYRVVIMEESKPRESSYVDLVGWYNPMKEGKVSFDEAKVLKWLQNGAEPTDTVRSLLSKNGILKKFAEQKKQKNTN